MFTTEELEELRRFDALIDAPSAEIAAYQKTYRATHKAEIAAYYKAYYATHKAELVAYQKTYRAAHKKNVAG